LGLDFLTADQLLQKNIIILNHIRDSLVIKKITQKETDYLNFLLKYFEDIEEYRYCSDIMKIFEMNNELFSL